MADWPVTLTGNYTAGQLASATTINTDLTALRDAINQLHDRFGTLALNTTFYQKWPRGSCMIKLGKDVKGNEVLVGGLAPVITGGSDEGSVIGDLTGHVHITKAYDHDLDGTIEDNEFLGSIVTDNSAMHNFNAAGAQQNTTVYGMGAQPWPRMDDADITPLKLFKVPSWMGGMRLRHFSVTNMSWVPFSTAVNLGASAHNNNEASLTGVCSQLVYSCGASMNRPDTTANGLHKYTLHSTDPAQTKYPPTFGVAYSTSLAAMNVQAVTDSSNVANIAGTVAFLDDPWEGWPAKTSTANDSANDSGQKDMMTYRWGEKTGTATDYAPAEKTCDMNVALAAGNYIMIYCKGSILARNVNDPTGGLGTTTQGGAVYLNRDAYLRFDCTLLCDAMPPIP